MGVKCAGHGCGSATLHPDPHLATVLLLYQCWSGWPNVSRHRHRKIVFRETHK